MPSPLRLRMKAPLRLAGGSLTLLSWMCGSVQAKPPPPGVAEMIEAAAAAEPETLKAVVRVAKRANPDSVAEIDAQVTRLEARAETKRKEEVATRGLFEGWEGKGELGGAVSSGNTDQESLAVGLELERDGRRWWSSIDATADLQREDKEMTKERYFVSLANQYKFTQRFYAVGVLWGEGDRFAGYYSRFSESVGLGYRLIHRPDLKLRVEAGPALRQADYIDTGWEQTGSFRVAEYLSWKISPDAQLTQRAIGYLQSGNSTLIGSTALTTKVYDALAARASFEVRYESAPPSSRKNTDTTTRLTLVYSF